MSDTPELARVAAARRALSEHAGFPTSYWVVTGAALVLMAGIPIWASFLPGGLPGVQWALLGVAAAAAAWAVLRRRRSGVALPRSVRAYPGARRVRPLVFLVTLAGLASIHLLVGNGQRVVALVVLVPVAVLIVLGNMWVRARMRDDIAAGRVTP
ncbi:hypothetical protein WIS52_27105 [Pseudonocardia nematodicida]|uniref:Transmembrane protein n=1 Tax=Pseudonocardia nematodicida TaxID=1206997 RepID=A0ABV1KKM6_9PSEU